MSASHSAAETPAEPLAITIDSLSPSTIPKSGPIRVSGEVTNVDDTTWTTINFYPFLSDTPMTTSAELDQAAATPSDTFVGERIIDPGPYDIVDELAPGETLPYSFSVPRSRIVVDEAGVYWFGVHALGEADTGRDDVADGRARTFLPLLPKNAKSVDTALVVPIRRGVRHDPDGRIAGVASWTRNLSLGGRLRSLVDFGVAAGSRPISWLIDPAVVDTVESLVAGNPPRSVEPTIEPGGADGDASTSADPSPDPGESGGPTDGATEGESGDNGGDTADDPELAAASEAGTSWLDRLHTGLEGSEILTTPYGDVDVDGAARHYPQLYRDARERSGSELAPWGLPTSPVVASPSGYLDGGGIRLTEPSTTILATDRMFPGDPATVNRVDGRTMVAVASAVATGGPGPNDPLSSVALRQRIVSDAALRSISPGHRPLVVVFPSTWSPSSTTDFFDGLDLSWLNLTTVGDITQRVGHDVAPDRLDYPDTQADLALDGVSFTAASSLIQAGDTLQNLLTLNDQVAGTVRDEAYTDVSYATRIRPWLARSSADRSRASIEQLLRSVRVDAPKAVILSSGSGRFSATITNDLDQPVTVKLHAVADPPLKVFVPKDNVDIGPEDRRTVLLNASSSAVGVRNVTLQLTDSDDVPLGSSADLPIRSNRVSNVIWLILGTGVALLFGAIAVRLFRRIRAAARS